ncbi:hypothetical protein PFISCL1PPCAC_13317, partial [Pristionchus fissidentatus]
FFSFFSSMSRVLAAPRVFLSAAPGSIKDTVDVHEDGIVLISPTSPSFSPAFSSSLRIFSSSSSFLFFTSSLRSRAIFCF